MTCLLNAFEHMHFQSCSDWKKSFGIHFGNLAFEIVLPKLNENRLELFSNQLIVDRTEIIRENFRANLPMMMIIDRTIAHSIVLVEQENDFNSLQTANVTVTFHHQVRCSSFEICCSSNDDLFVVFLVIGNSLPMSSLSFKQFLIQSQVEIEQKEKQSFPC